MAGLSISDSTNLTLLDSRIFVNVCIGQFTIDLSPSVFIGSGASNVLGAKVQITNPYGAIIKPYTGAYDMTPPSVTAPYEFDIPTQAGKLQFGVYTIAVKLTDSDNTEYTITKQVNVCSYTSDSHACDNRLRVEADCANGRVNVAVGEPPTFKSIYAESKTTSLVVDYPTASGQPQLTTTYTNFSLQLFQGVYKFALSVCATYNMGNNVYLQLPYSQTLEKNVKCLLDYSCIYPQIKKLHDNIDQSCSQKEKENLANIALNAVLNLWSAELANRAGADPSPYIDELEKLLGCQCTCDCLSSPIINNTPATNIAIEGCNITQTQVGLTTVFTFNNKNYFLQVDSSGVFGISDIISYDCNAYQVLTFNPLAAYSQMASIANSGTEYLFWASVINKSLNGIDATCLGYNTAQWTALTFSQKIAAIKTAACAGVCSASVSSVSATQLGPDVLITFTQTGGFSSDIYVDGVFQGNVLASVGQITLPNFADGDNHDYSVIPKCSNGVYGSGSFSGIFGFLACPVVSPPSVTSNSVTGVDCPFDLTSLIYPEPPLGITIEYHSQNNHNASSLVGNPTTVSSGVYYLFAKNADGCYSGATVVTVICGVDSCTAPQGLLVTQDVGGNKVSFQSAGSPPPSNSYTVKRKAAADPDVDGSYTTIGTPVWNASSSRWEITDTTAVANTLYTYKAQSNCASGTPYVLYNFAALTCPSLAITPHEDSLDYSFVDVGGEVNKYEVSIWDAAGATLLQTHTILPAFSNPITGTFTYLTEGTIYKIRVKVFIGTFSRTCDFVETLTSGGNNFVLSASWNFSIDSATGTGVPVLPPTGLNGTQQGSHTGITGDITVTLSGSLVVTTALTLYVDEVLIDCKQVSGAGVYVFNGTSISAGQSVRISINNYTC